MALQSPHDLPHRSSRKTRSPDQRSGEPTSSGTAVSGPVATRVVATLRYLMGFVFLWAFLDKTFGLGYATPAAQAWIHGGSPTKGYLSNVAVGPLQSTFHQWAGATWADLLFMLGLLGIGLALVSGVALRITALGGTLLLALMWASEWPPARHLSSGAASMSSNPFADYHLLYAVTLIALAALYAGDTWGLGRHWATLPIVRRHPWLR